MLKRTSMACIGLLAALHAWVPAAAHAQIAADTLTLEQVVERALKVSPEIVQAESSIANALSSERVALGNYLPSLSLSTSYGLASAERIDPETNAIVSGSNDSYRAGLNAGVDVFTGGRRGAEMRRANSVTEAAEATLIERRFASMATAKRAYFDVA